MDATASPPKTDSARTKLLRSAIAVIRTKGYNGTSIEDLCADAGVTKGAFFHHFDTKEALAVGAAQYWSAMTDELFAGAPYHRSADPLARVLGYIEYRAALLSGPVESFTCLVGTMVQETFATSPAIRAACEASMSSHAQQLEADMAAAMTRHRVTGISPASLALHTQAVLQGAFILAKARGDAKVALESVEHLERYLKLLFKSEPPKRKL